MKIIGVYKITNIKNGKSYYGSSKDCKKRLREHKNKLKKGIHENPYLQKSFNKHGWQEFDFQVFQECSAEDRYLLERLIIIQYKANDRKFGYNIEIPTDNGGCSNHSLETKLKLSKSRYNKLQPGISFEDWKAEIEKNKEKKIIRKLEKSDPSIYQIDANTGEILNKFGSTVKAGKALFLNYKKIQEVLTGKSYSTSGKRRTYKGFVFIYCKTYDSTKDYKVIYPRNFSKNQLKYP